MGYCKWVDEEIIELHAQEIGYGKAARPPSFRTQQEMLTEKQIAEYLNVRASLLRRWRLLRKGSKFLKIGSAVRYKRDDVQTGTHVRDCNKAILKCKTAPDEHSSIG